MNRLSRVLRAVVGELHWSAPPWAKQCARPFRAANALRLRSPRTFWGMLAGGVLASAGAFALERWIASWPQPEYLAVSVSNPEPTPLHKDASPNELLIRFSGAAAPLDRVGKPVTADFEVSPEIAGVWKWQEDSSLVFTPAEDWPVGGSYRLTLRPGFLAPQAQLERDFIEFRAPPITASIASHEFYEDPTDPKNKRVVVGIQFTHPVDKASLEKHIALRRRSDPEQSFSARSPQLGFELRFDEWNAKAFVRSEPITIGDPGAVQLELAAGVLAERGGVATTDAETAEVAIPGVDTYFHARQASAAVVTRDDHGMERVVTLEFSALVSVENLRSGVQVFELPADRPAIGSRPVEKDYVWTDTSEIVPEVLAQARRVQPDWLPSEPEWAKLQTFRFDAAAGRALYVRVEKGVLSFGDYALARPFSQILRVEPYPRTVEILHDGSLLALSGGRQLSVLARNLTAIQVELARLLPSSVVHLASQTSGRFQNPDFESGRFGVENLAEVTREVKTLPATEPGEPQYVALDLGHALSSGPAPRGLFEVKIRGWDPVQNEPLGDAVARRIVLLSDLGFLVKDAADGTHQVFVLSVATGRPVPGAAVQILGKNGLPVISRITDSEGCAEFPATDSFERERAPAAYVVEKDGDYSFLPFARADRRINWSRFDVGGVYEEKRLESLQAFLFSDRGIYRPGEEVAVGLVIKSLDWKALPPELPLEISVLDPRGLELRSETLPAAPSGFQDWRFSTFEDSPTGVYQVQLHVVRDVQERARLVQGSPSQKERALLGQTSVRVEEFQPDRLRIDARLSADPIPGWISPQDLRGRVALRNLFGTPAVGNRVQGNLQLSPSLPSFPRWTAWRFFDPLRAKQGYQETLGELQTSDVGEVEFPLALDRFERATYRLHFGAEGFESEGGRSVSAVVSAVVSPLPYLVGWKADGDLSFVKRDSERSVELIAVGPSLDPVQPEDLRAERIEISSVKVLTRQPSGLFAYQSVEKETPLETQPLAFGASPTVLRLPTEKPGRFAYLLRDAAGAELNRIPFEVVGEGNVAVRVERNAELRLSIEKPDYGPGEEIEVSIQAPYAGSGLLTIERERVYASKWFTTSGNSTVQRIRVPAELEGNGYLVVSFLRDSASREIFYSALSSGAVPFSVSRSKRAQALSLQVPAQIEPGQPLRIGWTTGAATRLAVLAVDEGILQVGRWSTPDPLGYLLRKRALTVSTSQLLDLVLPEYEIVKALAAPAGDEDALRMGNLNPFKRKGEKPVAYWSGIQEVPAGAGSVDFVVPDSFHGTLRVVALAVSDASIGVAEEKVIARGPFVVQPTVPYFAAPGDEFEATALVANVLEGSGPNAAVALALETSPALEVVGPREQSSVIPEGRDALLRWRVRVKGPLGPAQLRFRAAAGGREATTSLEMSVRPASPRQATLATGVAPSGRDAELPVDRKLYAELREVSATASASPLGLIPGLARYLEDYPHACSEQLVSQALPGVLLAEQPDLRLDPEHAQRQFARTLALLHARQNADGGFGLWSPASTSSDFIDAYATHFLLEARERGRAVPENLLRRAFERMSALAEPPDAARTSPLWQLRARSYALYLLTRRGEVKTAASRTLRDVLQRSAPEDWKNDVSALFLAATFAQLQLADEARALLGRSFERSIEADYAHHYDSTVERGLSLYLLAKHFPERARELDPKSLLALAEGAVSARFNTISSAMLILGLDAWASVAPPPQPGAIRIVELSAQGAARELTPQGRSVLRAAPSPDAARVRFSGPSGEPLFHQLVQSGFDVELPRTQVTERLEVTREIRAAGGAAVTQTPIDAKLDVVLYVRSADSLEREVAVVDLLPGGFEVDLSSPELAERVSLDEGRDTWSPTYIDVREDRVVFYGSVGEAAQRFVYRIKPTNRGRFTVPPVLIEGLYDRAAWGRGPAGEIQVVD